MTDGRLLETTGTGFILEAGAGSVASIVVGAGGAFALMTDGRLLEDKGPGFIPIPEAGAGSVASIAAGAGGVFALMTDGRLLETTGTGFVVQDAGVKSFLVGRGGKVDVLETNGKLWQYSRTSPRILLDQSVQTIWLSKTGYTLDARETSGNVRQFAT
jgi:hypothetical protein